MYIGVIVHSNGGVSTRPKAAAAVCMYMCNAVRGIQRGLTVPQYID